MWITHPQCYMGMTDCREVTSYWGGSKALFIAKGHKVGQNLFQRRIGSEPELHVCLVEFARLAENSCWTTGYSVVTSHWAGCEPTALIVAAVKWCGWLLLEEEPAQSVCANYLTNRICQHITLPRDVHCSQMAINRKKGNVVSTRLSALCCSPNWPIPLLPGCHTVPLLGNSTKLDPNPTC